MIVLGSVLKLSCPQARVNEQMQQYQEEGMYRGVRLRTGLLKEKPIDDLDQLIRWNRTTKCFDKPPRSKGQALHYPPRPDFEHFIERYCTEEQGFSAQPFEYFARRTPAENIADIKKVVTLGGGGAELVLLEGEEREGAADEIAKLCHRLYSTLQTNSWCDHSSWAQKSWMLFTRSIRFFPHQWPKKEGRQQTVIRRELEKPQLEALVAATPNSVHSRMCTSWNMREGMDSLEGGVDAVPADREDGGESMHVDIEMAGLNCDKAQVDITGCQCGGAAATSYCCASQYIPLGGFTDPVCCFCAPYKTLESTNSNVQKGPIGRSGLPLRPADLKEAALRLELVARGKAEAANPPPTDKTKMLVKPMKAMLVVLSGGDQTAPAIAGDTPDDAAARLWKPLMKRLALGDCTLHDLKAMIARIYHETFTRQDKEGRLYIISKMIEIGQGPGKGGMCGRDWRKVLAYYWEVFAKCTERQRRLVRTLAMMSEVGLYLPEEKYNQASAIHYTCLCRQFAVDMMEEFGKDEHGVKLPPTHKLKTITIAGLFGRHYMALVRVNATTVRLEPLRFGSTEGEEEYIAEMKNMCRGSFFKGDVEGSCLTQVNRCAGMVRTSTELRQTSSSVGNGEGTIRRYMEHSLNQDTEPGLAAAYKKSWYPSADMMMTDEFMMWLITNCDLWIRDRRLGLTGDCMITERTEVVEEDGEPGGGVSKPLTATHTDGNELTLVKIDFTIADQPGVLGKFSTWCDNRQSMMQFIIHKLFVPHFMNREGVHVPGVGEKRMRSFVMRSQPLCKVMGLAFAAPLEDGAGAHDQQVCIDHTHHGIHMSNVLCMLDPEATEVEGGEFGNEAAVIGMVLWYGTTQRGNRRSWTRTYTCLACLARRRNP
jgi:hypothetical protein